MFGEALYIIINKIPRNIRTRLRDFSSLPVNYVNSNTLIRITAISAISTISINTIRTLMYT